MLTGSERRRDDASSWSIGEFIARHGDLRSVGPDVEQWLLARYPRALGHNVTTSHDVTDSLLTHELTSVTLAALESRTLTRGQRRTFLSNVDSPGVMSAFMQRQGMGPRDVALVLDSEHAGTVGASILGRFVGRSELYTDAIVEVLLRAAPSDRIAWLTLGPRPWFVEHARTLLASLIDEDTVIQYGGELAYAVAVMLDQTAVGSPERAELLYALTNGPYALRWVTGLLGLDEVREEDDGGVQLAWVGPVGAYTYARSLSTGRDLEPGRARELNHAISQREAHTWDRYLIQVVRATLPPARWGGWFERAANRSRVGFAISRRRGRKAAGRMSVIDLAQQRRRTRRDGHDTARDVGAWITRALTPDVAAYELLDVLSENWVGPCAELVDTVRALRAQSVASGVR